MMQQLASYARNALKNSQLMLSHQILIHPIMKMKKKRVSKEEKRQQKSKMMSQLLDEFDDDIDRIKSSQVPKSVKYSVYSFGFLVIFLILWGTISEIDTTISASGKITTVVPNVEVQSNYDSVVKDIYVKKGQSVEQGEPLIAFDSTLQKADKMKLNYQLNVLNSKIDRLKNSQCLELMRQLQTLLTKDRIKFLKIKEINI